MKYIVIGLGNYGGNAFIQNTYSVEHHYTPDGRLL